MENKLLKVVYAYIICLGMFGGSLLVICCSILIWTNTDYSGITAIIISIWTQVVAYNTGICPVSYQLIGAVCGTNGITYPSICDLENARALLPTLDVALLKPCNNYCTENWDPICGSDMVTYANSCLFSNAMKHNPLLKIFHHGQCLTPLDEDMSLYHQYYKKNKIKFKPKRISKKYSETAIFV